MHRHVIFKFYNRVDLGPDLDTAQVLAPHVGPILTMSAHLSAGLTHPVSCFQFSVPANCKTLNCRKFSAGSAHSIVYIRQSGFPKQMSGNGRRSARSRIKSSTEVDELDRRRHSGPDRKVRRDRIGDHSFIRILNFNTKALLGFVVLAFFLILFLILHLTKPVEDAQRPRVVTPFAAPKIMDLPQVK